MSPNPVVERNVLVCFFFPKDLLDLFKSQITRKTTKIQISGKKKNKKKTHSSTAGKGLIEHACQISRRISRKRREHWTVNKIRGDTLEPACTRAQQKKLSSLLGFERFLPAFKFHFLPAFKFHDGGRAALILLVRQER